MEIVLQDIDDVTLIDEVTKSILTDDVNTEIPSNMTMYRRHLVAKFLTNALWWLNFQQMHVAPPVD